MAQRAIRFTETTDKALVEASRSRGYSSPSAFIRHAVEQEIAGRTEALTGAEERLAASIEQARRETYRLGRAHQAMFAYLDSLAKVLLTCIPEPAGEAGAAAVARARSRHARLLKSAGQSMVGESKQSIEELVGRVDG